MSSFPFETDILVVRQPFGDFYLCIIPVSILLQIGHSHQLKAKSVSETEYKLEGAQRPILEPRLRLIGNYINTTEAAFPNSIIIAANYPEEESSIDDDNVIKWTVDLDPSNNKGTLKIPTAAKLGAIIDGQHRLFAFGYANPERLNTSLACAIYFDLPKPYQAFLFATINSTQKPVSKSQTYELFGYNVEDEPAISWTPDKLAVFLTRKLNSEEDSIFRTHIIIAAENDIILSTSDAKRLNHWLVSTATIVEGISRLISKNSKRDANTMHKEPPGKTRLRSLLEHGGNDEPPLRSVYIEGNDFLIYTIVKNFFNAAEEIFWKGNATPGFIQKTVGFQALFQILKLLLKEALVEKNVSSAFFQEKLRPASKIDFNDDFFHASGAGKTRIRNCILLTMGMADIAQLEKNGDWPTYQKICAI